MALTFGTLVCGLALTTNYVHADDNSQASTTQTTDQSNQNSQDSQNVEKNNNEVINSAPDQGKDYNEPFKAVKVVTSKNMPFYTKPGTGKKGLTTTSFYNKKLTVARIASVDGDVYYRTTSGWVSADAFNQKVAYTSSMDYKMQVTSKNVPVFSAPDNTSGSRKIGTTSSLGLSGNWYNVDMRKDTNLKKGFYRFTADNGKQYWIAANNMSFNLSSLKGNNAKIEKAIATGESLIGKSKYSWGGGRTAASIAARRFDCSSFVHFMYAKAGVTLGPVSATTYTLKNLGTKVSPSNMKRGDIFFFNAKGEGAFCHVGLYLGDHLFIHDSPSSDTGGVGVSSLLDKYWSTKFNGTVRRVVK